jgi:hypothetical protein
MKDWVIAIALALLPGRLAAEPGMSGFNFSCWNSGCYSSGAAQKNLQALAQTGAGWSARLAALGSGVPGGWRSSRSPLRLRWLRRARPSSPPGEASKPL